MRVLGIDPGATATGWGVVESKGNALVFVAAGVIRTTPQAPFPDRLQAIFKGVGEVIRTHRPQAASVEEIFMAKNPQSAIKLGHARGAAMVAAGHAGLPVSEFTALHIKKAVVGFGQAEKAQVQQMVARLLNMEKPPPQDAADALAAGICFLNTARIRVDQAVTGLRGPKKTRRAGTRQGWEALIAAQQGGKKRR